MRNWKTTDKTLADYLLAVELSNVRCCKQYVATVCDRSASAFNKRSVSAERPSLYSVTPAACTNNVSESYSKRNFDVESKTTTRSCCNSLYVGLTFLYSSFFGLMIRWKLFTSKGNPFLNNQKLGQKCPIQTVGPHVPLPTLWSTLDSHSVPILILYAASDVLCVSLNSVVVTTPSTTEEILNEPIVIFIDLNDGSRLVANQKFTYRLNPRFTTIQPRNHLFVYVTLHWVNE